MRRLASGVLRFSVAVVVAATAVASSTAQAPQPPAPTKSVRGTLLSVDTALNSVIMTETSGDKLAWHFEPAIVAEAARFKPGDPVIVIYRQLASRQKRVTAIAFPGSAKSPIYVNLTGDRVVIRSVAGVDGACEQTSGAVSESTIPVGGLAEIMDGCWCCAPAGATCQPTTKSGLGRAFLAQCF